MIPLFSRGYWRVGNLNPLQYCSHCKQTSYKFCTSFKYLEMRKYKNVVQNENEQLTNFRFDYVSLVLGPITTVTVLGTIQRFM